MLDVLRKGAQSWGIKVLFGIIIIVFVFTFGMSRVQSKSGNVLATINETPILVTAYQEQLQRSLEQARAQSPELTTELLMQIGIKQQVFEQMVTQELLVQKAAHLGLTVSKEELANEIHLIAAFHNEANRFDPEIYKNVLRANNLSPGAFESSFQQDLLLDKLRTYIGTTGKMTADQVLDVYNYGMAQGSISYLLYPWQDYTAAVNATEEEINQYYEAHKSQYQIPDQIKIAYVEISPTTLANESLITNDDVQEFYEKNKEQFKIEEQVHASHLLIRVDEDAPEEDVAQAMAKIEQAQAELKDGKPFAEVAQAYTEDPSGTANGGSLGWFGRGRMVPPFEEAAFALEPGQISDPVRTQFGFHLIEVQSKQASGYEELEQVQERIVSHLAREQALDTVQDYLDQALELIYADQDVQAVAQSIGLQVQVQETDFFSQGQGPRELNFLSSENLATLFDLQTNATTSTPLVMDDGYLLATKIDAQAATIRPLDEVRDAIVKTITQEAALKLAQNAADEDLALIIEDDLVVDELLKGKNATLVTADPFGRQDPIGDLGANQEASLAIFNATQETWLPSSYAFPQGYALIKVLTIDPPQAENWEEDKEMWIASMNQHAEQQLLQELISELRSTAKVKILNPGILDN